MKNLSYALTLLREFGRFSKQKKIYWLVPLVVVLAVSSAVIVASHVVAPFIYTLF